MFYDLRRQNIIHDHMRFHVLLDSIIYWCDSMVSMPLGMARDPMLPFNTQFPFIQAYIFGSRALHSFQSSLASAPLAE